MRWSSEVLEQLSDFMTWKGSGPLAAEHSFTLLDYVMCVGTPDLLFAFVELLMPSLVFHEGHYFFASGFSIDTYEAWKKKVMSITDIQKVMNHIHIESLFQGQDIPDAVAVAAAHTIACVWSKVFADKGIVGKAYGATFEDAEVTLYQPES
jgi:hypothetical protein